MGKLSDKTRNARRPGKRERATKPTEGTWTLVSPEGRHYQAESPLRCVRAEMNCRVPDSDREALRPRWRRLGRRDLSAQQAELLAALRSGVVVYYMGGFSTYYFRSDTMKHCTTTVEALIRRGLAERYAVDWRGAKVRAKDA